MKSYISEISGVLREFCVDLGVAVEVPFVDTFSYKS